MKKFADPYQHIVLAEKTRFVSMVSSEDYGFFCSVRPIRGNIQTTINIIFKWLVNELNRRNITDWSKRDAYERFIIETFGAGCPGPVANRRTAGVVLPVADAQDDTGGSEGGDSADTSAKGQHTNKKRRVNGGSKRRAEGEENKTAEG